MSQNHSKFTEVFQKKYCNFFKVSYLNAFVRDSGVDEELDPLDTTVSTTGNPLSLADEMSFSLFDRR